MQPKLFLTRLILVLVCLSLFYLSCSYYLAAFNVDSSSQSNQIDDDFGDEIVPKGLYERLKQEWDENVQIVNPKQTGYPCDMSKKCADSTTMPFKIVSGAANIIGPRICVNGVDLMRSVLNNVDRGMNIAVVDGRTGDLIAKGIFDLYAHDSTLLIKFMNDEIIPREHAIVLATSFDDAAMRLSTEARGIFKKFQFDDIENLKFRDNFVFLGGIHAKSSFSKISKHDKDDKYGDWPAATEVEGCIEKL